MLMKLILMFEVRIQFLNIFLLDCFIVLESRLLAWVSDKASFPRKEYPQTLAHKMLAHLSKDMMSSSSSTACKHAAY